ncbi:MAG: hypothetical protein CBARDCOR_4190 [uncultured Caballeronia sp.]|nr:MAG: hypothetical protein CBARDCOR_4190 [uncultured Caballeronia sp.]
MEYPRRELKMIYYLKYLEMHPPTGNLNSNISIVSAISFVSAYKAIYEQIGEILDWRSKAKWTLSEWGRHLRQSHIRGFILFFNNQPAGIYEIIDWPDSIEIYYFCISPHFQGCGLSRLMLRHAISQVEISRLGHLWLKTNSNDHQRALPLYLSEGFFVWNMK